MPISWCVWIANSSRAMGASKAIRYHLKLARHKKSLETSASVPFLPSLTNARITADMAGEKAPAPIGRISLPEASRKAKGTHAIP